MESDLFNSVANPEPGVEAAVESNSLSNLEPVSPAFTVAETPPTLVTGASAPVTHPEPVTRS